MTALKVDVFNSIDARLWNEWVSLAGKGTLFQTTYWADRLCELWKCKPYYFVVRDVEDSTPVLVVQALDIYSDYLPLVNSTVLKRLRNKVLSLISGKRRLQWFGQPVVIKENVAIEAMQLLLSELVNFCRVKRIRSIGPCELSISHGSLLTNDWQKKRWATFLIDLTLSDEDLWKNLKNSARKAIRHAIEKGVTVRRIQSVEELRDYYDFACRCAAKYGKDMYGFRDFETMWRHFHDRAIFETFVAEHEGTPIAGLSIWGYKGIISELGSFNSQKSVEDGLYGGDLIKWKVIKWGHKQGFRTFDLAGVNPFSENDKERGIRQFKEKWEGKYYEYYLVSRVF